VNVTPYRQDQATLGERQTDMLGQYQVAVIGTGSIGLRHCQVLARMAGVTPIAVPRRLARVAELRDGGFIAVPNLDDAARLGARACIIATDTGRHVEDGARAVEKGLHLLVEKPLSTDAGDASRLCAKAGAARRKVFVACLLRFSTSLNAFRDLLNEIGDVHYVRIECQSYLPDWRPSRPYAETYSARIGEGGVLRDLVHELDYAGWLFGWPLTLQVRVANLGRLGIAVDETADLMWEAVGARCVSVRLDYLSRPTRRTMTAYGQRGTLEWDGVLNTVSLHRNGEPVKEIACPQTTDEMLLSQSEAFVAAVRGGDDGLLATGADGVRVLAVCDAARRASENRRAEKVDYP
jgi:predicted dehydrogenase